MRPNSALADSMMRAQSSARRMSAETVSTRAPVLVRSDIGCSFKRFLAARDERHRCAFGREQFGDREADTFARSADDGNAILQREIHNN